MLGSYYPPYFSTPGQVRVAPGVGAYYPTGVGAYYPTGVGQVPMPSTGMLVLNLAMNAAAGYFVGKQLGYPMGTAAATGVFGLPGLFVAALYASSQNKKGVAR